MRMRRVRARETSTRTPTPMGTAYATLRKYWAVRTHWAAIMIQRLPKKMAVVNMLKRDSIAMAIHSPTASLNGPNKRLH